MLERFIEQESLRDSLNQAEQSRLQIVAALERTKQSIERCEMGHFMQPDFYMKKRPPA